MDANTGGGDKLTYILEGPKANLFSIDGNTGQISTKSPLNHEDPGCAATMVQTEPKLQLPECTYDSEGEG